MEGQDPAPRRNTPWTLIVFGALAIYAVVVALLNSEVVKIDFLFFSARIRLLILILLCLAVGFAAGFFAQRMWRKRGAS